MQAAVATCAHLTMRKDNPEDTLPGSADVWSTWEQANKECAANNGVIYLNEAPDCVTIPAEV